MTKRKIAQIFAFINLLIICTFAADTYVLPVKEYPAWVKEKNMAYTRERPGYQGYSSWLIRDQNGIQYSVPDDTYYTLNLEDSFTVLRSGLFKKAIQLRYDTSTRSYCRDIGVINETFFGVLIILLIILFSLIQIFVPKIFRSDFVEFKTTIFISSTTVVAIFFYFYHQA